MKSHNKIWRRIQALLLLTAIAVLPGCDFLVKDVPNQTTEEDWWKTYNQLSTALDNIYRCVPGGTLLYNNCDPADGNQTGYSNLRVEMEGITDNGVGSANYVSYVSYDSGTIPTNDIALTRIWTTKWKSIRRASRFLENYHRAIIAPDRRPLVTRMAAEARALRAFYHLELFLFYGEIPIVSTTITPAEQNLVRRPADEVVEWIASELKLAAADLPEKNGPGYIATENWRWSKGACYAWMSYIYLFAGDWENAKKWAAEVIESDVYELFRSSVIPEESYARLFLTEDYNEINNEEIFLKKTGMAQARLRLGSISKAAGNTVLSPTLSLVNEYELANGMTLDELTEAEREELSKNPKAQARDPRLKMSIIVPGDEFLGTTYNPWAANSTDVIGKTYSTTTGFWVKKWANKETWEASGESGGKNHFYLMRYAVVLLNYAEAAIEMWDQIDATEKENVYIYLNDIRNRAGMPDVDRTKYSTQAKLRELVRRERRVELAFEGHRLFDLRRWKTGVDVMNGPVFGGYNTTTEAYHQAKIRLFNDRDYLWPIPSVEISTNANMLQNKGY